MRNSNNWTKGMPLIDKVLFDEAGIYVKQYNDGQDNRLDIDISGHYDKQALKELKRKVRSLKIDDSISTKNKERPSQMCEWEAITKNKKGD